MRPFNLVKITAVAAAGQAVVNISADPGNFSSLNPSCRTANNLIAANDYVVYQAADGTFVQDTVSSVSTLAITLANNLPTGGVLAGSPFWWYGIETDTNPNDAQIHPVFTAYFNSTLILGRSDGLTTIPDLGGGLNLGKGANQPMIIVSNNATTAGQIESVGVDYIRRPAI